MQGTLFTAQKTTHNGVGRGMPLTNSRFRLAPLASALALLLSAGVPSIAHAGMGGAWFASSGSSQTVRANAASTLRAPDRTVRQQKQANQALQQSIDNLARTASLIAAQQSAQAAAREAAKTEPSVPDGYQEGGLWDKTAAGNRLPWYGANRLKVKDDTVTITQTESKAILNWTTFNVGRNTTVVFDQKPTDAVLNKVVGKDAAPSVIQGSIRADGMVMIANQNGVIFSGSSQVDVRSLVVAATRVDQAETQFRQNGLYSVDANTPAFSDAAGAIDVRAGARISTLSPSTATQGGGYVLLMGREVHNAGTISAPNGQVALAAGDDFIIARGQGSDGNAYSSTRGNVVTAIRRNQDTSALAENTGLLAAATGDITLTGAQVSQAGVAVSTTSVDVRGTVHLQTATQNGEVAGQVGTITLAPQGASAILLDENTDLTALDSQRSTALEQLNDSGYGYLRTDLSLIQITSDGTIDFQGGSVTLATGGQIQANAGQRTLVQKDAILDVSGAVGVRVAMESNSLLVNIQGNEQRDAPVNRDSANLNNGDVWVDRRDLIFVRGDYDAETNPDGTADRWYTAGGLLEVSGYVANAGHTAGEWMAQGGTVTFMGNEAVTQRGSIINLSGGTLDVQSGYVNMSWLRGADGRLYNVSTAPGDILYTGIYNGFEDAHARWGEEATRRYYSPLIAPGRRYEHGYTVGRDAGTLIVATPVAVLEGDIVSEVYQGDYQDTRPQEGVDGYNQSQQAASRRANLIVAQNYVPTYDADTGVLSYRLDPTGWPDTSVVFGSSADSLADNLGLSDALPEAADGTIFLNSESINRFKLGAIDTVSGSATVDASLQVDQGGRIRLLASEVQINADLTARSGSIVLGASETFFSYREGAHVTIADGVKLDARGVWSNLFLEPDNVTGLPYVDGGSVSMRSAGAVMLGHGSSIDVSSGGVLERDGTLRSVGAGGDVTLAANAGAPDVDIPAVVTIGGNIYGYGVKGSGTLTIETGSAVGIGGELLEQNGILQSGEIAPADLVLTEALNVAAGQALPFDYHYTKTRAGEGELISLAGTSAWGTRGPAYLLTDWVVPIPVGSRVQLVSISYNDPGGTQATQIIRSTTPAGSVVIPAGSTITSVYTTSSALVLSFQVPAGVFQDGFPIVAESASVSAGSVLAVDATYAVGTIVPAGTVLSQRASVLQALQAQADLFSRGFSSYSVKGQSGLFVVDNAMLNVQKPVYRLGDGGAQVPTGSPAAAALEAWLPPLYQENPITGIMTQREGADLVLSAGSEFAASTYRTLRIGQGAVVSVDPGASISLSASGQLTVEGTLNAWGGSISLRQIEPAFALIGDFEGTEASSVAHSRSIWIGDQATIDVAGRAVTAVDQQGRNYGLASNGGSIVVGGEVNEAAGTAYDAPDLFVVVRPGALLDASGAKASLYTSEAGEQWVYGAGGSIAFNSADGLYLDGTIRAYSGGGAAAGGTLSVALSTPYYNKTSLQDAVMQPREFLLRQEQGQSELAAGATPGTVQGLTYGHAVLGADRIGAGGFDNVVLFSNGLLSFDTNVSLSVGESLRMYSRALALAETAPGDTAVSLSAPYVRLAGARLPIYGEQHTVPSFSSGETRLDSSGTFRVDADLIDVRDRVAFGAKGSFAVPSGTLSVERRTFNDVVLYSAGDIRFLQGTDLVGTYRTTLTSPRNISLLAAQIYPTTGANAQITVGPNWGADTDGSLLYDPAYKLVIGRTTDTTPEVPYSVFGTLTLGASTIEQGGVLRAPLGSLVVGGLVPGGGIPLQVTLLPGSVTSVSAAGLTMPYGGTTDGIAYQYAGQDVTLAGVGSESAGGITIGARKIEVKQDALLDLSGGGELTGAGFVSGRGGSTDVRYYPLVQTQADGFTLPSLATNPIYAIVPGAQASYAPVAAEGGAVDPKIGQQITIGTGVPGLPAGTYTLLPSTYALLPGAFRVELNGAPNVSVTSRTVSLRNGSYSTAARLSSVNTAGVVRTSGIQDSLLGQVIVTPADVVRQYSQYVETSYADFINADAERLGAPRAVLPADGKTLRLSFKPGAQEQALVFEGLTQFQASQDGYDGAASLYGSGGIGEGIEIVGAGSAATLGYTGITLQSDQINAIGAPRLQIGGYASTAYGKNGKVVTLKGYASNQLQELTLRSGASLSAPEVFLIVDNPYRDRRLTIEPGATINTIGRGAAPYDSTQGYVYTSELGAALAVSNGWLDVIATNVTGNDSVSTLAVGVCQQSGCTEQTQLYSEGTISLASESGQIQFGDAVRYGTRNLSLSVGAFNIGNVQALADAEARQALPVGLTLNQALLDRLLAGDTEYGAPALENLILTARDALNFFGTVSLDTRDPVTGESSLQRLVLNTQAIYGAGTGEDVATIGTGTLIWNGSSNTPGAVIAGGAGAGSGILNIDAERIEFGYGPGAQASGVDSLDRLALGFSTVNLNANDRVTSNNRGTLSVYASRGDYETGSGYAYSGGNLNINAPLITGENGSVNTIKAGGAVVLHAPEGSQAATVTDVLGAELAIDGNRVTVDTAIVLPSGKLTISAQQDVSLAEGARIDMAGRQVDFYDVSQYSWGGDVTLESRSGSITQVADSVIDLSALNNQAGRLTATALAEGAGVVDLQGGILGSATGYYDAGGTMVPYSQGGIELHAQRIADFTGLNQRLSNGQVFGLRSFQIKEEGLNLVVGDELRATQIEVSVDNGSLSIQGRVDASGERVGSIRLSAGRGLTLGSASVLDAHSTVLRVDSYGQIIDAPNRASVELNAGKGRLVLADGASVDLRAGTDAPVAADSAAPGAGENDGAPLGTLALFAPRLGGVTAGDIDIDARGTLDIRGAQSIVLNANQRYADPDAAQDADAQAVVSAGTDAASGQTYRVLDQAYLDRKHLQSQAFMTAALADINGGGTLAGKLEGLRAYQEAFHLRPGVEIVTEHDLRMVGDVDLSGYRYASVNPYSQRTSAYGSGEPGTLTLRAVGDIVVNGSLNDGFYLPTGQVTPDDNTWMLKAGTQAFGVDVAIPTTGLVTLADGTTYKAGKVLNYAVPVKTFFFVAGTVAPTELVLSSALVLPADTVVAAPIYSAAGTMLYATGTRLAAEVSLPAGTRLAAGSMFSVRASIRAMTWPAGVPLLADMTQNGSLALKAGAVVPWDADVKLAGNATSVNLRAATASNGQQGYTWAVAKMLPAGALSWSMRLVAGADTAAADTRATQPGAMGDLILSDAHTATNGTRNLYPVFSVLRTGTGDLDLLASGDLDMQSLYGVYTAGTQSAVAQGMDAADYDLPRGTATYAGNVSGAATVLGAAGTSYEPLVDESSTSLYAAYYPESGGNVLVRTGRNLMGLALGSQKLNPSLGTAAERSLVSSSNVGNWLWRQGTGTGSDADDTPTAWWINFGTYTREPFYTNNNVNLYPTNDLPYLSGFTGIGTLGGGNLAVQVAGNMGDQNPARSTAATSASEGVNLAIASTGRVTTNGTLVLTGGGDLDIRVAGRVNPGHDTSLITTNDRLPEGVSGTLVNLRGAMQLLAGAIGGIDLTYEENVFDVRAAEPTRSSTSLPAGGLVVIAGDSTAALNTREDLVLVGTGDAGRVGQLNTTPFSVDGTDYTGGGDAWFSLWTDRTAINLFSAGGNLTASEQLTDQSETGFSQVAVRRADFSHTDGRYIYPSIFSAVSASGSVYIPTASSAGYSMLLAPSASGSLQILAQNSIYGNGATISVSGADPAVVPTALNTAFSGSVNKQSVITTNLALDGVSSLFAFGANSVADTLHGAEEPVRFYANDGDIVGLQSGSIIKFSEYAPRHAGQTWYEGSRPVWMLAGRDIVASGSLLGQTVSVPKEMTGSVGQNVSSATASSNLFAHRNLDDISVVSAGRDIIYSSFNVAGPGMLDITAGRNLRQDNQASIASIGPIVNVDPNDQSSGASISITVGAGKYGPDYTAFLARYLNPANVASTDIPLADQPGKIVQAYNGELTLVDWLHDNYGYVGGAAGASAFLQATQASMDAAYAADPESSPRRDLQRDYQQASQLYLVNWLQTRFGTSSGQYHYDGTTDAVAFFNSLPTEQQRVYARNVYFAELKAGGREYNDDNGPRPGSYLRGREAIATLFPSTDAAGQSIAYDGSVTLFGDAGIQTRFGGDIQVMTPGGSQIYGVEGLPPPGTNGVAGVITQGAGNIQLFSLDDILLGQSRVMTTYGGDILAWAVQGDINAGRGSKTTQIYTPVRRLYDAVGNVALSPTVPSTGAGFATLNPLPSVPPGDVDLYAPLGTIDAGEAGIRASGNVNVAALQVVNAANIKSQGDSVGVPTIAAVNVGALTSASAAASSAASSAQDAVARSQAAARQSMPSIISVQVLGFGEEGAPAPVPRPERPRGQPVSYDAGSAIQLVGNGQLNAQGRSRLTEAERRNLAP